MSYTNAIYKEMGIIVRNFRENARISQVQLANRIGLTRTSISNIENGRQKIQVHTLYALANALGVGAKDLLPPVTITDEIKELDSEELGDLHPQELDWVKKVLFNEEGHVDNEQK